MDTKSIWATGKVTSDMYSFALLDLDQAPERLEWRDNINTEADI